MSHDLPQILFLFLDMNIEGYFSPIEPQIKEIQIRKSKIDLITKK